MKKRLWFVSSITILVLILSVVPTMTVFAAPDCGATASSPTKSGSVVVAVGALNCGVVQSQIKVNVELATRNGYHFYNSKTCYNTRTCSVSVSGTYHSGDGWQMRTSGYTGGWSWYTQNPASGWKNL
jgi:hypothetical protein